MGEFDFDRARRWARFDPGKTLARRPDSELPFTTDGFPAGSELMPDSCVYIDGLRGRLPRDAENMMVLRTVNHSTVAVQEMMHLVGRLDPNHRNSREAINRIGETVRLIKNHRLFTPDADVLGRAGLLAGMICRLQGYQKDQRQRALHDCVLYLQAMKLGLTVLTANLIDFDVLQQLLPAGRVLFYRPTG